MDLPNLDSIKSTLQDFVFPKLLVVETTTKCNLQCIMCPRKSLTRELGDMKFETWKKIIDEVIEIDPKVEIWPAIMGEPILLGEKLIEFISYAKKKGIERIILNTNANFMNEEMVIKLVESDVDQIIFGIDANSPDIYNKIRIGGDLKQVEANILSFSDYLYKHNLKKPLLIAQFIEMDENTYEREAFKKKWLGKGVAVKLRRKLGWGWGVKADNLKFGVEKRIPCPWIMRTMSIHWNGRIAQCDADFDGQFYAGDIRSNTLKEVWDGELRKRRDLHWRETWPNLPCSKCNDWKAGFSEFYLPEEPEQILYKPQLDKKLSDELCRIA